VKDQTNTDNTFKPMSSEMAQSLVTLYGVDQLATLVRLAEGNVAGKRLRAERIAKVGRERVEGTRRPTIRQQGEAAKAAREFADITRLLAAIEEAVTSDRLDDEDILTAALYVAHNQNDAIRAATFAGALERKS